MNTDKKELHRGEIYICDFVDVGGSVQNGLRPALIIQNSAGNEHSTTVIVSPITSIIKKDKQPTHIYLGAEYGLPEESMVMLEQIFTVDKNYHIRDYVGLIEDKETLSRINDALRISLALNRIRKNLFRCTEDVLSFSDTGVFYIALCDKCRKKLAQDDRFLMGKVNFPIPLSNRCNSCEKRDGFYYILKRKRRNEK